MILLCDKCHEPIGDDAEEIGGDLYCGFCAEEMHERERQEAEDAREDTQ